MPKVGIITCSREPNYGACLQAFATQKILEKLGCQAEILNYTFEDERSYLPFKHKNPKTILACIMFYRLRYSQYLAFDSFHKKMAYSERVYKEYEDFKRAADEYDIILTGSDQVWNPLLGIDIGVTLQEFYHSGAKKISYASSFGISELAPEIKERYRKALSEFSWLSVREAQGQKIISALLGREVPAVLDPTMLFTSREWSEYEQGSVPDKPYILFYDMRHNSDLISYAEKIASQKNCEIAALSRVNFPLKNIKTLKGVTPGNMLSLFRNAEYVVTDSFHGTVFSILYHKPFSVQCSGEGVKLGSRIVNLLEMTGLTDRLLSDYTKDARESIDFTNADKKLSEQREYSLEYLRNAVFEEEDSKNGQIR